MQINEHLEETVKLLNHIHENPESTQRELVEKLDFSLGKVNYLIQAPASISVFPVPFSGVRLWISDLRPLTF